MPDATPLNAVVHGAVTRPGYTVEKVYFEACRAFRDGQPLSTNRASRTPAGRVLLPHGHWEHGRYMETPDKEFTHELVTGAERFDPGGRHPLQAAPAQLAKMGVIAFLIDLEGYADSVQIPSAVAHGSKGRPKDSPAAPGLFFHAQTDSRLQSIMASRRGTPAGHWTSHQPARRRPVADWRQRASGAARRPSSLARLTRDPPCSSRWSWSARGCRVAARARTPTTSVLVPAMSRSPR